jgi:hypothetical protein
MQIAPDRVFRDLLHLLGKEGKFNPAAPEVRRAGVIG